MKIRCGRYRRIAADWIWARRNLKTEWHLWFAWHPVKIGKEDCRWLERVYRRLRVLDKFEFRYTYYEYRARGSMDEAP